MYALYQIPNKLYTQKIMDQILRKNNIKCKKDILHYGEKITIVLRLAIFATLCRHLQYPGKNCGGLRLISFFFQGLLPPPGLHEFQMCRKAWG